LDYYYKMLLILILLTGLLSVAEKKYLIAVFKMQPINLGTFW